MLSQKELEEQYRIYNLLMKKEEKGRIIDHYLKKILGHFYSELDREGLSSLYAKLDYKFIDDEVVLFTKKPQSLGYFIHRALQDAIHEKIVEALKLYSGAEALSRYLDVEGGKNSSKGLLESTSKTHFIIYPLRDEEIAKKSLESHPLYSLFKFEKAMVPAWLDKDNEDFIIGWVE